MKEGAVFLDRDGVVTVDPTRGTYHSTFIPGHLLPDVGKSIARINELGWRVFILTNQAGIAHGILKREEVDLYHACLRAHLKEESSAIISGIYVCPHAPDDFCECRKPAPGLFHLAADETRIDLKKSISLGNRGRDIEAGLMAGVPVNFIARYYLPEDEEFPWRTFTCPDLPRLALLLEWSESIQEPPRGIRNARGPFLRIRSAPARQT